MESVSDDDDADDEGAQSCGPLASADLERINETTRGRAESPHGERPTWPAAWISLICIIRACIAPIFWEVFSGSAGLSKAFREDGWGIGPPIDVLFFADFDLLNVGFVCVVLGLIAERRIRYVTPWAALLIVLHGGE